MCRCFDLIHLGLCATEVLARGYLVCLFKHLELPARPPSHIPLQPTYTTFMDSGFVWVWYTRLRAHIYFLGLIADETERQCLPKESVNKGLSGLNYAN